MPNKFSDKDKCATINVHNNLLHCQQLGMITKPYFRTPKTTSLDEYPEYSVKCFLSLLAYIKELHGSLQYPSKYIKIVFLRILHTVNIVREVLNL